MLDRSERERSAIWSSTVAVLSLFEDARVREHTASSDFDLRTIMDGPRPTTLYLQLNISDMARMRPLTRLIMESLLAAVVDRGMDPPQHPLLCLLDEYVRLGYAQQIEDGLSYLRGYGCRVAIVAQDAEQLWRVYGERTSLLASCATW